MRETVEARSLLRRSLFCTAGGWGAAVLLSGCATPTRGPAVPIGQTTQASVLGLPNERFFPFYGTGPLQAEFQAALQRWRMSLGLVYGEPMPELQLLAVSGGGEDGAFGAGLLCGWTAQGSRPEFELVTGVSTGALSAPFAYLGSSYDPQLRTVYTELTPSHVLKQRYLTAALFNDALADNSPLYQTISRYLTPDMLVAIAKAYGDGRLLFIGSTDLDAQQPIIWNVGAIAASGHPRALDTIRRLLLASAAIPAAFPPTMFDVMVDGKAYQEMDVDGGAFVQTFLYPASVTAQRRALMANGQPVPPAAAYIIRNGRLDPEWATVERRARNRHHDRRQRLQRRLTHLQHHAKGRCRFQPGLYRARLQHEVAGAFRPRLHACAVQLWLPARSSKQRVVKNAADVVVAVNCACEHSLLCFGHGAEATIVILETNIWK